MSAELAAVVSAVENQTKLKVIINVIMLTTPVKNPPGRAPTPVKTQALVVNQNSLETK